MNCPSHPTASPLLHFREDKSLWPALLVPTKGSEHFLSLMPNSCHPLSPQGLEHAGRKGTASCYEIGAATVARAGTGCLSWPRGSLGPQVCWCAEAYLLPLLLGATGGATEIRERTDISATRAVCLMLSSSLPAQCEVAEPPQLARVPWPWSQVSPPAWGPEPSKDRWWWGFIYAPLAEPDSITATMYPIAARGPLRSPILLQ